MAGQGVRWKSCCLVVWAGEALRPCAGVFLLRPAAPRQGCRLQRSVPAFRLWRSLAETLSAQIARRAFGPSAWSRSTAPVCRITATNRTDSCGAGRLGHHQAPWLVLRRSSGFRPCRACPCLGACWRPYPILRLRFPTFGIARRSGAECGFTANFQDRIEADQLRLISRVYS